MAQPNVNDLRIIEITNAFRMQKRYVLQEFRPPEKALPDDPDGAPIWTRLADFSTLKDAQAAQAFIQTNNSIEVVNVIL